MKTLVPLSGGLDSTTVLAGCIESGGIVSAIGFNYGQKHKVELDHAEEIAKHYGIRYEIIHLPLIPKVNDLVYAGRNLILAAMSISIAQSREYGRVAFGCNASDWADFPDCRPEFWANLTRCAEYYGIFVLTPLIHSDKKDIVKAARKLDVPIELTWSCYCPVFKGGVYEPCGECLACKTREAALAA